jgi:hypothetical protein
VHDSVGQDLWMWGLDFSPGLSDRTPELKFPLHTDLLVLTMMRMRSGGVFPGRAEKHLPISYTDRFGLHADLGL